MKVISVNIHAVRARIHKDMTHGCLDQAITLTHLVDKLQLLRWRTAARRRRNIRKRQIV